MATNVIVEVKNGNVDSAIKVFKRKVKDYKVMVDYQNHSEYIKPSLKKRGRVVQAKRKNKYDTIQHEIY